MKEGPGNYAFIDGQNVNLAIRGQGWALDFARFRRYLAEKYTVTKAFPFIGYVQENQSLYINLQKDGYILVLKPTLRLPDGTVKGNVDAELVLHTMIEWQRSERALIVSGDGDFYCLVEHLIKNGKLLHLMVPNTQKYSSLYRKWRPHIVFMNELRGKLERA